MTKYILGAVAVVAIALGVRHFFGQKDAEWQARVERVSAMVQTERARADAVARQAVAFQTVADSLRAEAARRDTVIVTRIERLPVPPPDCEAFTLPRDSVILEQERRYGDILSAFDAERQASARLYSAFVATSFSADSLQAVLDDRPRPLSPLIPRVGLGVTAGICTTGQPCAAVGLTLSWEVKL